MCWVFELCFQLLDWSPLPLPLSFLFLFAGSCVVPRMNARTIFAGGRVEQRWYHHAAERVRPDVGHGSRGPKKNVSVFSMLSLVCLFPTFIACFFGFFSSNIFFWRRGGRALTPLLLLFCVCVLSRNCCHFLGLYLCSQRFAIFSFLLWIVFARLGLWILRNPAVIFCDTGLSLFAGSVYTFQAAGLFIHKLNKRRRVPFRGRGGGIVLWQKKMLVCVCDIIPVCHIYTTKWWAYCN